ncbi:hypothetical protein HYH03_016667 [Edaphochlamys debaryana]|uniref:Homeobox domain-containing protein n=1 Tax=Edaphochlamys debaryana TaxID=47281 RepID=A0A835XJD9_9CHLO|nr:hypothetical protein HYH03_016667 [Edaphochlamys debaryana]|eukprot:KAG2484529.1 hypothetical protein HYH03_016667 [Edaphochlamys debaryana]
MHRVVGGLATESLASPWASGGGGFQVHVPRFDGIGCGAFLAGPGDHHAVDATAELDDLVDAFELAGLDPMQEGSSLALEFGSSLPFPLHLVSSLLDPIPAHPASTGQGRPSATALGLLPEPPAPPAPAQAQVPLPGPSGAQLGPMMALMAPGPAIPTLPPTAPAPPAPSGPSSGPQTPPTATSTANHQPPPAAAQQAAGAPERRTAKRQALRGRQGPASTADAQAGPADDMDEGGSADEGEEGEGVDAEEAEARREQELRLLLHPRLAQLLAAVVEVRKAATRHAEGPVAALSAQQSRAMAAVEARRREAQRPGGPPLPRQDPALDKLVEGVIAVCQAYADELTHAVFTEADCICADWDTTLTAGLLKGTGPKGGGGGREGGGEKRGRDNSGSGPSGGAAGDGAGAGAGGGGSKLVHVLKDKHIAKIKELQEEFSKRKKVGKLPPDVTAVLRGWFDSHYAWPYPTDPDKRELGAVTGLNATQINNWFINQRKRHWLKHFPNNQAPCREEAEIILRRLGKID